MNGLTIMIKAIRACLVDQLEEKKKASKQTN
jgi:hypothetical protein